MILGGAFENSLTSKCLLFTKIWPNNSSITIDLVLPWIYVAIAKKTLANVLQGSRLNTQVV